jgi:hypothetical protein
MPILQQKAIRRFASPSNMAMATLVSFLSVGYVTDWKMLRGRPSKSSSTITPALPRQAAGLPNSRLRYVRSENGRPVYVTVDPRSEVADSRAAAADAKYRSELD